MEYALIKARKIYIQIRIDRLKRFTEMQILYKSNSTILHLNETDYNLSLGSQKLLSQDFLVFLIRYLETILFFLLIFFYFSTLFQKLFFQITISLHLWAYSRFSCSISYPHQLLYLLIIQLKEHLLIRHFRYQAKVIWTSHHQIIHYLMKKQQLVSSKVFFSQGFLKSSEKSDFIYKAEKKLILSQV